MAFILLPVVIAGFFGLIYYIYFIERPKSALEATFFLDALHIIHGTLLIESAVYVQTYIWWLLKKSSLSETGVHLKPLLGKYRTINWDRIPKAAIFDVYWGRKGYGEPYIIGFLNPNKYPLELKGDLGCFIKRRHLVMLRATEENVREFESFWGKPLEKGKQYGSYYCYWM